MGTSEVAGNKRSILVTDIGLLTVFWGVVHAVLGCSLFLAGEAIFRSFQPDRPVEGFEPIFKMLAAAMKVVGGIWLLQGIVGGLAGWGVLSRKRWGRLLAIVVAVLAILWSLFLQGTGDMKLIAIGVIEFLYGVFAIIILLARGSEFS